jgi:transglutaminase-like putative cysteine protease
MRKVVFFVCTFALLLLVSGTSALASSSIDVDSSDATKGIVKVKFNTGSEKKIKLLISNGNEKIYYNLSNEEEYIGFPLQLGDGTYSASIYENTSGTKYRKLFSQSFDVKVEVNTEVYLNSIQEINWNKESVAVKLADELLVKATKAKQVKSKNTMVQLTEAEKIDVIYDYVVRTISYDYNKIKTLQYDYLPDIDQTLKSKSGICYDYSSLLAAMLRSQGIPTKMVKGYTTWTSVYHAWNEIYLVSEKRWVIVDSTYDAYMVKNNRKYTFEKATDIYKKSKEL